MNGFTDCIQASESKEIICSFISLPLKYVYFH